MFSLELFISPFINRKDLTHLTMKCYLCQIKHKIFCHHKNIKIKLVGHILLLLLICYDYTSVILINASLPTYIPCMNCQSQ